MSSVKAYCCRKHHERGCAFDSRGKRKLTVTVYIIFYHEFSAKEEKVAYAHRPHSALIISAQIEGTQADSKDPGQQLHIVCAAVTRRRRRCLWKAVKNGTFLSEGVTCCVLLSGLRVEVS